MRLATAFPRTLAPVIVSFFILFFIPFQSQGQASDSLLFETRAVWFATVLGDGNWPESILDNANKQTDDLRLRISSAWVTGMNTFVFQAVARGDAMYPSTRLPWSARLHGPGIDPGYDPLAVAIDKAHLLGMELHVWFNVFRVGDTSTADDFADVTDPTHVLVAHPGWVADVNGDKWIDPSSADAEAWLVDNVMEIVENYDLDGIHFDFARYPQGGLPDDVSNFQFDPRGFADIDDWRRDNVTRFIRDASNRILAAKPWVKIGAAPVGNYRKFDGAWPALWGYDDVYQDSREWLNAGYLDYIAPQTYFDIGRDPEPGNTVDSPDFAFLAHDWVDGSPGRPVFTGIGLFKSVVNEEAAAQIDTSRVAGAQGEVFFRYDDVIDQFGTGLYVFPSLPAPMTHRFEAAVPTAPVVAWSTTDFSTIEWAPSAGTVSDPVRRYAVFIHVGEAPERRAEDLFLEPPELGEDGLYRFSLAIPVKADLGENIFFRVAAVSRLGIISDLSNTLDAPIGGAAEDDRGFGRFALSAPFPNPARERLSFEVTSSGIAPVHISVFDALGRRIISRNDGPLGAGARRIDIDLPPLASGVYALMVESGSKRATRQFVVVN